jgi:hypothetical protein
MAKLSKLSSIGGLAVAGAALGLYLGSSAVSEINPAYYSTPFSASSFHADLVPNPGAPDIVRPLPELAQAPSDLGSSCVSCSLSPDEYALVNYPSLDSYASSRPVAAGLVLAEAEEYVGQGLSPSDARDIERYAHFRVSDEEGSSVAVAAEEENGDRAAAPKAEEEPAPGI